MCYRTSVASVRLYFLISRLFKWNQQHFKHCPSLLVPVSPYQILIPAILAPPRPFQGLNIPKPHTLLQPELKSTIPQRALHAWLQVLDTYFGHFFHVIRSTYDKTRTFIVLKLQHIVQRIGMAKFHHLSNILVKFIDIIKLLEPLPLDPSSLVHPRHHRAPHQATRKDKMTDESC